MYRKYNELCEDAERVVSNQMIIVSFALDRIFRNTFSLHFGAHFLLVEICSQQLVLDAGVDAMAGCSFGLRFNPKP